MYFIIRLLVTMVAILIIAYLLPNVVMVESVMAALVAAFCLGIVNTFIRPVVVLLTLPLTVVTLGLFLLIINGFLLWLVSAVVRGFHVNGFWGALLGAVLISMVSWLLTRFLQPQRRKASRSLDDDRIIDIPRAGQGKKRRGYNPPALSGH
jgi:putative membrane protein